jgi:hypothetical protein
MSGFYNLINAAVEGRGPRVTEGDLVHYMGPILYRLLHLRFPCGTLDEAVRIALVAFSSPIFLH